MIRKKTIIIIIFIFIVMISNYSFGFILNPVGYEPVDTTQVTGSDELIRIANKIITPIKIIGSITSIVGLIIIGIKYILGSVEEKAEYKKTMMPYIIGAVMVFGITNLLGIIVEVVGGFK